MKGFLLFFLVIFSINEALYYFCSVLTYCRFRDGAVLRWGGSRWGFLASLVSHRDAWLKFFGLISQLIFIKFINIYLKRRVLKAIKSQKKVTRTKERNDCYELTYGNKILQDNCCMWVRETQLGTRNMLTRLEKKYVPA